MAVSGLSIIAIGHVQFDAIEPLTKVFDSCEELVLDVEPRALLEQHRTELNRAIDAATNDWVIIVRERERVGSELAAEIAGAVAEPARAWGYRIQTTFRYRGLPLQLPAGDGELRLVHRRHLLRQGALSVQGTVIRLQGKLEVPTFDSRSEHLAHLEQRGVPHSRLRRLLLFLTRSIANRITDRNTLAYLWIESGFDQL